MFWPRIDTIDIIYTKSLIIEDTKLILTGLEVSKHTAMEVEIPVDS